MFKITNIQATRTIGAVLILLSGNAFAASVSTSYATQTALNTEIAARKAADTTEATARNTAIGTAIATEVSNRNTAIATERTRAIGVEGTLNAADTAEVAGRNAAIGSAIGTEVTSRNAAIAVETTRAMAAEAVAAGTKIADGTTAGDMLYWDETQIKWVVLPAPNPLPIAPAKATLSFCNGVPTWKVTCPPTDGLYKIGDIGQAGGVVIDIWDAGLHGIEVAPVNPFVAAEWDAAIQFADD